MRRTTGQWAMVLRMLCAVALLMVGFAHKPAMASVPMSPAEIAAYTLPDGTIGDLCHNQEAHPTKKPHPAGTSCDACRIGSAMLVPAPADLVGLVLPFRLVAHRPLVDAAQGGARYQPGAPPRAPPFLLI
ncbi:hypothetical protein [Sinorhizobium sp. BG8]|uniref:hypothetical protein n=1 Tax=Sinorhizobium sp. BG8 TaxID=2613773 RepID=UPI00193E3AED|nr:hypothetical protein [Sinorhizobium sp. BG8]QRM54642.1 hypothetical protein F3Y30_08850 [Sinorhizobium sp. BG8]